VAETLPLAAAFAAVLAGAAVQRITGMGMSLICAPILMFIFGPLTGVALASGVGLLASTGILALTWRFLDLRRGLLLAAGASLVIPPAAFTLRLIDTSSLKLATGVLVLGAVLLTLRRETGRASADGTALRLVTGAFSGILGVAAGVGGPPAAVYAARVSWAGPSVVPTFQLLFLVVGGLTLASAGDLRIPAHSWIILLAAMAAGFGLGSFLASRVPAKAAQRSTLWISAAGAIATAVSGVQGMLAV
jgi:uncharacterized membrane protein YfcA